MPAPRHRKQLKTPASGDVLELLFARVFDAVAELAPEVVVGWGSAGHDNNDARPGELLQTSGNVHLAPVKVVVLLADHVAEVDADAELEALGRSKICSCLRTPRWIARTHSTVSTTLPNSQNPLSNAGVREVSGWEFGHQPPAALHRSL